MTGHMPPVPPANRTDKGPKQQADRAKDAPLEASHTQNKEAHAQNTREQGDTANIKHNTANKGFFQGRRVK